MKYEEIVILLPCHSLEDFPVHYDGDEADGLLGCWTAMWHPALLASAGAAPTWRRMEDPPEKLERKLIVVPPAGSAELPTGFPARAKNEGACLVRKLHDRDAVVAAALESLDGGAGGVDPELAEDFLALGYCFLQVQLLTRQMRYSSNLDEVYFGSEAVAAARAAMQGDAATARQRLTNCFNVLAEERGHYYGVESYLLDLTIVAPTTLGASLRQELAGTAPVNVLVSGETLELMAANEPETLAALRQAVMESRAAVVGGEYRERKLPLLSEESILHELEHGLAVYEKHLGRRPLVFGRRRFGLVPALPAILHKLGFLGAVHATLDDGQFPEGSQSKSRWEGADGAAIDAITRAPRDATRPDTFLSLAIKMGESMDRDHVATLVMAHWPAQASRWYGVLRRCARYVTALGKFVTADDYFRNTDVPSQMERFVADQYRSPYLKQAVIRRYVDPISGSVRYWRHSALADAAGALTTLAQGLGANVNPPPSDWADSLVRALDDVAAPNTGTAAANAEVRNTPAARDADAADDDPPSSGGAIGGRGIGADDANGGNDGGGQKDQPGAEAFAAALQSHVDAMAEQVADRICAGGSGSAGCLVLNPCSFVRRVGLEVPLERPPEVGRPVYAAASADGCQHVVVDVPPMGFVWLSPDGGRAAAATPPLADEYVLRNEYFEVIINETTGALQSIHKYTSRSNLLSQQVACRVASRRGAVEADDTSLYSVMTAESVEVTASNAALGEITAKGRLLDREGKPLARFRQRYRLWRGSRVLQIDGELDIYEEPRADAWNSYYALRFAWADEAADMWRAVNLVRQSATARRFESPHYVEIEGADSRTVILTGGLPYHRRVGMRMLDSLLVVRGERRGDYRVGIGVDVAQPLQAAIDFLAPTPVVPRGGPPSGNPSSWLFHIDAKNVVATGWSPRMENGRPAGFCVRVQETAGRPARFSIGSFRPARSARQVNLLGQPLGECLVEEGRAKVELAANEWSQIEVAW